MQNVDQEEYTGNWSIWTQRIVSLVLFAVLIAAIIMTGPFLPSIFLASLVVIVLYFPIRTLAQRARLGYTTAAIITFVLYLLLLGLIFYLIAIPIFEAFTWLTENLQMFIEASIVFLKQYTPDQGWLTDENGNKVINLNFILEPLSNFVNDLGSLQVEELAAAFGSFLLGAVGSIGNLILNFLFVHLLAIYALIELPAGFRWLTEVVPPNPLREYSILIQRGVDVLSSYVRGLLINTVISSTVAAIMLLLFGVSGAIGVALLATIFLLIPIIGGYIAGALIFLAAFFTADNFLELEPIIFALVVYLTYTLLQGGIISTFVEPRVYGQAVAMSVTLIIIGLAVFGYYTGFLGMVLAVPILGVMREILTFITRKLRLQDPYPGEPEPDYIKHSFMLEAALKKRGRRDARQEDA